jgi:CheY-like chemotaxis protein
MDPQPTSGQVILLVDDTALIRSVGALLLAQIGYRVLLAAGGSEAVTIIKERAVDLVLMDVDMPGMDGCQAAALIRSAEPPGRHVPIIAMTGRDEQATRAQASAAGMDEVVTKPMQVASLRSVLIRWLDGQVPVAEPERLPGPPPDPVERLFDREVVELYERMQPGSGTMLLGIFRADLLASEAALIRALAASDGESLERISHKLKGAALTVGATALAMALKELEQGARSGDVGACGQVWMRVRPLMQATLTAIAGPLDQPRSAPAITAAPQP